MIESLAVVKGKKMAKILKQGNKLYLDYRLNGERIRKSTGLDDTKENRRKLEKEVIPALMMKIKLGDFVKPDNKKFSYYFSKFLIEHEDDKSYQTRRYVYEKVNQVFGDMEISKIRRLQVSEYLKNLSIKNSSKKDYQKCLKGVFDLAIDDEVINNNLAVNIKFPKEEKEIIEIFSPTEIELMLERADVMFRNFIAISLYTGLRTGEALGLMRQDIQEDRICVRRSISKGSITSPKTIGSVRDIPILDAVRPFLESQLKVSNSLYLFDYKNTFINDANFFRKRWHTLVAKCEIQYRRLYCTRHTFITAMLNSGKFKIMEIASIVGHTSAEMIMKNYSGFIKAEHLKIDTNINLFDVKRHSLDIAQILEKTKEA